jgi:hypothetical protein
MSWVTVRGTAIPFRSRPVVLMNPLPHPRVTARKALFAQLAPKLGCIVTAFLPALGQIAGIGVELPLSARRMSTGENADANVLAYQTPVHAQLPSDRQNREALGMQTQDFGATGLPLCFSDLPSSFGKSL